MYEKMRMKMRCVRRGREKKKRQNQRDLKKNFFSSSFFLHLSLFLYDFDFLVFLFFYHSLSRHLSHGREQISEDDET